MSFGVEGGGCCSHDGLDFAKGGGLFLFDRRVLDNIGIKLTGGAYGQSSVRLGVWIFSRVGEDIHEVGHRNHPPLLRNPLFPKLFQALLGVVHMKYPVSGYF